MVERLHLPRNKGGRKLRSIEKVWEQVSMVIYLGKTNNIWLQVVLRHWVERCRSETINH